MRQINFERQQPDAGQATPHPARLWFAGGLALAGVFAYGAARVDSLVDWMCLASITLVSMVPGILWLRLWRSAMPIVPLFAIMHIFNFALPFASTSSEIVEYDDEIKITSALVLCLFMLLLTAVWALAIYIFPAQRRTETGYESQLVLKYLPYGLVVPAVFSWLTLSGDAYALGDWMSVARAVFGTAFDIAVYLFGVLWGARRIGRRQLIFCLTVLCINVVLFWATLYLYSGIFAIASVLVGYTFGSGRVPVVVLAIVIALTTILHAGKAPMRERYWGNEAVESFSVQRIPQFMVEWFGEGVGKLVGDKDDASYILVDRVGLMHMLMRVVNLTPTAVDYLHGETYAMIPGMLVPRFINPEKPSTRDAQVLLNTRYSIMTFDETESTSVGWGMLAEAFANFGLEGVIFLSIILGFYFALATVLTSGAAPLSMRTIFGIVVLVTSINLEGDTALFVTVMLQAFVGAMLVLLIVRTLGRKKNRGPGLDSSAFPHNLR